MLASNWSEDLSIVSFFFLFSPTSTLIVLNSLDYNLPLVITYTGDLYDVHCMETGFKQVFVDIVKFS